MQPVKRILWENVRRLMKHRYGADNLTQFCKDVKIGPGSASRIKQQQTSIGLNVLEKIAAEFRVEPWQLLVPGFDPDNPPTLNPSETERMRYRILQLVARQIAKDYEPDDAEC